MFRGAIASYFGSGARPKGPTSGSQPLPHQLGGLVKYVRPAAKRFSCILEAPGWCPPLKSAYVNVWGR